MLRKLFVLGLCCSMGLVKPVAAQPGVFLWKDPETLVVKDGISEQTYRWRDGVLLLLEARSLSSPATDKFSAPIPDRTASGKPVHTSRKICRVPATVRTSAYSQLDLHAVYPEYEVLRSMRVYDNAPGIEWRLSVKGVNTLFPVPAVSDKGLIEAPALLNGNAPYYFFLPLALPHFTIKTASFHEATDHHSNPVSVRAGLPYRKPGFFKGSVLVAENNAARHVHLLVKLSPLQEAQSIYAGFDFSADFSGIKAHSPGIGLSAGDDAWQEAYPVFSVMYAENEEHALNAYKRYELSVHRYIPQSDNTFTMNTWGDRNRDSRINEEFILDELDAAARLGITHYQIDDGWQKGVSNNSAVKTGHVRWDDWKETDWEVNPSRFPNGLDNVKRKAASLGIGLGLWFNPSKNNNYAAWERDRDILLRLHREHGISWIKIDGMLIGNKQSENRVCRMLQGARERSDGLQFNMDVTAGKRGGYFFFNHLGNIFLENRYTDWGNYYPHLTLRNVWILSKYVPIQRFQIEWLNKWRNEGKYPARDPLRPRDIPFDYQFAVTMMGQPLAWMEATALPDEAFSVTSLIDLWKEERSEMQRGIIHPLGEMPDGYRFTGFVSYAQNKTYVLLFRENTTATDAVFELPLGKISGKRFVKIAGEGKLTGAEGASIKACFSRPFQFLWGYFE